MAKRIDLFLISIVFSCCVGTYESDRTTGFETIFSNYKGYPIPETATGYGYSHFILSHDIKKGVGNEKAIIHFMQHYVDTAKVHTPIRRLILLKSPKGFSEDLDSELTSWKRVYNEIIFSIEYESFSDSSGHIAYKQTKVFIHDKGSKREIKIE